MSKKRNAEPGSAKGAKPQPIKTAGVGAGMPPDWLQRWGSWVVVLAAVFAYANTFQADFTLDDVPIVKENQRIRSLRNIPLFFQLGYWQTAGEGYVEGKVDNYRPLTMTSYAVNYTLHGIRPAGYHVTNVLLHAGACILLLLLVRRLFDAPKVAFAAALLFAVHPIHTEAVAGVVGRAEILALLGILLCGLGYVRARSTAEDAGKPGERVWIWMGVSLAGYLLALFSKENGVIAPALILLWEILLPSRRWLLKWDKRAALLFVGFLAALGLFLSMRPTGPQGSWTVHEGFVNVTPDQRLWTALRTCAEYVGLLLAPVRLSADYWITDVPIAKSCFEPGVLLAVVVLLGALVIVVWSRRRWPGIAWGLGVFAMALFPVSNLPFAIGIMKAERILYTPSAGFLVALCACLPWLWRKENWRVGIWAAVWLIAGLFIVRTIERNHVWHDNHALAVATLKVSPHSPTFHTIMSRWYRDRNENAQAREHLLQAYEQNPKDATTLYNLGNIDLDEKRYERAVEYYTKALQLSSNHVDTLNNLGRVYQETGRLQDATMVFNRVLSLRPDHLPAYINIVSAYFQMTNFALALPAAEEAARRFPNNGGVLWNLGAVYKKLGREKEGEAACNRALQLDPRIRSTPNLKGAQ